MRFNFLFFTSLLLTILTSHLCAQDSENVEPVGRIYNQWDNAYGISVADNFAYVAAGLSGLQIVDVSNPENPEEVGYYNTPGYALAVSAVENLAYVADYTNLGIYDCSEALAVPDDQYIHYPLSFILFPAYPNPFNSVTTIQFGLDKSAPTRLVVYDLHGQLVDVLLDSVMPAGRHSVMWDGSEKSAGVYLVRMKDEGGKMNDVQKIVLLK